MPLWMSAPPASTMSAAPLRSCMHATSSAASAEAQAASTV